MSACTHGEFSGGACVPPLASRQAGTSLIGDRGDLIVYAGMRVNADPKPRRAQASRARQKRI